MGLPTSHLTPNGEDGDPTHGTACFRLFTLKDGRQVPCGKCPGCRAAERARRKKELLEELAGGTSWFLSPSYSDDGLEMGGLIRPAVPEREFAVDLTDAQYHRFVELQKRLTKREDALQRIGGPMPYQTYDRWQCNKARELFSVNELDRLELMERCRHLETQVNNFLEACRQALPKRATCVYAEFGRWQRRIKKELKRRTLEARQEHKARASRICKYLRKRAGRNGGDKNRARAQCQRVRDRLAAKAAREHPIPKARLVMKMEYGDKGKRPHLHAILVKPDSGVLEAVVAAWGWELGCEPTANGRGHVKVDRVTHAKVLDYMGREMNRGTENADYAWRINGKWPPKFYWPRSPALGTGDWWPHLNQRYADLKTRYDDDPYALELAIQDTRFKSKSLRHRPSGVAVEGSKDEAGLARRTKAVQYIACPRAVWRQFIDKVVEPERANPTRRNVQNEIAELLADRNKGTDKVHGVEVEKRNLRRTIGLHNRWKLKTAEKGKQMPLQAVRDHKAMRSHLAALTGGAAIGGIVPDPALVVDVDDIYRKSAPKPDDFKEQPDGLGILRPHKVFHDE